jgi:hypothetical protein
MGALGALQAYSLAALPVSVESRMMKFMPQTKVGVATLGVRCMLPAS